MGSEPTMSNINVNVRILPSGDETDITLPITTTARDIIDALLDEPKLGLSRTRPGGGAMTYQLSCKETGLDIPDSQSLGEAGVKDGFTLLVMPFHDAGK